jgi:hypothetical protein
VNEINEFIPINSDFSHLTTPIMPYITKTIFSMSKINPTLKWSFESDTGLDLAFENTKIDYSEMIPMTQPMKTYYGTEDSSSLGSKFSSFSKVNPYYNEEDEEESTDKIKH